MFSSCEDIRGLLVQNMYTIHKKKKKLCLITFAFPTKHSKKKNGGDWLVGGLEIQDRDARFQSLSKFSEFQERRKTPWYRHHQGVITGRDLSLSLLYIYIYIYIYNHSIHRYRLSLMTSNLDTIQQVKIRFFWSPSTSMYSIGKQP